MNFKKVMAGLCAAVLVWGGFASTSVFDGGIFSSDSISAEDSDVIVFEIDKKKVDKGTKVVTVNVKIDEGTNINIDSLAVSIVFDSRLKLVQTSKAKYMVVSKKDGENAVAISASDRNYTGGTIISTLTFEVPDGDGAYYINWYETDNMIIMNTQNKLRTNENYRLESGYILVGNADVTDLIEFPTTEETTVAEETTAVTTTTAKETTAATTTTAKETTAATTTTAKETTAATTTTVKETTAVTTTTVKDTTAAETTTTEEETEIVVTENTGFNGEVTDNSETKKINYGDINKDGVVDLSDLTVLSLILLRDIDTSKLDLEAADVNGNGEINIGDLPLLKRYVIGDKEAVLGPID